MLGWHFLQENRMLRWGDRKSPIKAGSVATAEGPLILCENGVHASKRIIDALRYAPGPIVCRVELSGEIIHAGDKSVARRRRVIWMADATRTLHLFACLCAEGYQGLSPRSQGLIDVKRRWIDGRASNKELVVARDRYVAEDAAWAASHYEATCAANWAAGYWAAGAGNDAAANCAIREADCGHVWEQGFSAAQDEQNRQLTRMVNAIRYRYKEYAPTS